MGLPGKSVAPDLDRLGSSHARFVSPVIYVEKFRRRGAIQRVALLEDNGNSARRGREVTAL
jgi:hypothetical protein